MNPASAAPSAPPSVAFTISGPALMNVCSLSITSSTAAANPVPCASVNSGSSLGRPAGGSGERCTRRRANGTTVRLAIGAATMPSATASCPSLIPTATATANRQRARSLEQHEQPVRPEAVVPRQEAAGEVAGRVRDDRADEDPVQRRGAAEQAVLDPAPEEQRGDHERQPEPRLDRRRDAQDVRVRAALRDRPRQQLLDRPVEDGHHDEDGRPQQRDAPVLVVGQRVAREREVRVGDEAGDADADREDGGAAAVATRSGQGAWSRGRACGPPLSGRAC